MSVCCNTPQVHADPCPRCGHTGPVVGTAPVRPHLVGAVDGDWQHCVNEQCSVVYHLGSEIVFANDVATQVGSKATDKPTPVCFCFAHTIDSLAADLKANDGISTAQLSVKAAVADGFCACEFLNPSGTCCLPDIHRTVKAIKTTTLGR